MRDSEHWLLGKCVNHEDAMRAVKFYENLKALRWKDLCSEPTKTVAVWDLLEESSTNGPTAYLRLEANEARNDFLYAL
jgi:hypothetical protein